MIKSISSLQNPWLKEILALQDKSKNRRSKALFSVEGLNEIRLAIVGGFELKQIAINPKNTNWASLLDALAIDKLPNACEQLELMDGVWSKLVLRETGQNALAVFEMPPMQTHWRPKENGFYLIVESVEKPGNLGALLRSADAVGVDGVVFCDEQIDVFHPQVIRNSVGCSFTLPLFFLNSASVWDAIQLYNVQLFTTFMEESAVAWDTDLRGKVAFLVGAEHAGVSDFWRKKGTNITLPMFGKVDSLNVSVAAALLLYECKRQRSLLG